MNPQVMPVRVTAFTRRLTALCDRMSESLCRVPYYSRGKNVSGRCGIPTFIRPCHPKSGVTDVVA